MSLQSEPTLRAEVVYALRKDIFEQKPGIRAKSTMLDVKSTHLVIFWEEMLKNSCVLMIELHFTQNSAL